MRTVIHIGAEKTGTTALQNCFVENREALAAAGIVYPRSLRSPNQHFALALYAMDDARTNLLIERMLANTRDREAWRADLASRLAAELEPRPDTLLISTEIMAAQIVEPAEVARLKSLLDRWSDEYAVVLYMRRQDRATASLHNTDLRVGSDSADIFGPHPFTPIGFDYARVLDIWSEVFGPEAMRPRVYETARAAGGGLVEDFLACTALPVDPTTLTRGTPVANAALSAKAQRLLLEYNRLCGGRPAVTREEIRARHALVDVVSNLHSGPTRRPGRDEARAYLARFAEGNARVARSWFDRAELFDDAFDEYPEQPDPLPEITAAETMQVAARLADRLAEVALAAKRPRGPAPAKRRLRRRSR